LINALAGTKQLARASKTPGRTRKINFFNVGDTFLLADLPGYGYATGLARERQKWGEAVESYMETRDKRLLRMVYVLLDSRRGIMEIDTQWLSMLHNSRVPYKLLFTKTDRVSATAAASNLEVGKQQWELIKGRSPGQDDILCVSSTKRIGLADLKDSILRDVSAS